jgi:5'-nucleotidase (lipoprotein e(P4) family)
MNAQLRPIWIAAALATSLAVPAFAADAPPPQSDLLNATLWMQKSVEYKANSIAVFTLAKMRLDQALADKNWTAAPVEQTGNYQNLPPAIVVDVDETVLDNSPYEAYLTLQDKSYDPKIWTAWVNSLQAREIPGAVDFLKYAQSKQVKIFYVTNRSGEEEAGTRKNMEALGFPIDNSFDTVLTSREKPEWTSAKTIRRAFIAKDYRILLNLGDNFSDFTEDYKGDEADRVKVFEANKERWGREWIMLANPSYGSFEAAPFKGNFSLPDAEKRAAKRAALQPWTPPQ